MDSENGKRMDMDQAPAEQNEAPEQQPKKRGSSTLLIRVIIWVVVIVVAIVVILLLLRSCTSTPTSSGNTPSTSNSAASVDLQLANRVHEAIHPLQLSNKSQADDSVYIIEISHAKGKTIATLRLVGNTTDVAKLVGANGVQGVANDFIQATLAKVPEITDVHVVDFNGAPIAQGSR